MGHRSGSPSSSSTASLRRIAPSEVDLLIAWLHCPDNYQWLDFGSGVQMLPPPAIKLMLQRDTNVIRVFTDPSDVPIGVVGLSQIAASFSTAMLWYVLGDKRYSGQGYTSRAVGTLMSLGFAELALQSISAWVVERNAASIRILEHNQFRLIGRQRRSHVIEGVSCDRLLFDVLKEEHRPGPVTQQS
jgi:RimJ/RimL family protein N-acetyltransferase